jgi:hypothetical protein
MNGTANLNQIIANMGYPYTHEQLSAAFDMVKNPENWKNPINAIVPESADITLITEAIRFFTGSVSKVEPMGDNSVKITALGYYLVIGA